MVDLVVVKFIGSKNQSIKGKSWVPLLTFQERLISIPNFSRNRVARSLVFCVVFYRPFYVPFGLFSFGDCIVCPPIYGFGLSLCFLQIVQSHRSITSHEFRMEGGPSRWRIVRL